jgi:hypothetical protein
MLHDPLRDRGLECKTGNKPLATAAIEVAPSPDRHGQRLPGKLDAPVVDGASRAVAPHRSIQIFIDCVDSRGRFAARLENGTTVVQQSRQPFLDAARVLLRAGFAPDTLLITRRTNSTTVSLRGFIGNAAQLTVEEAPHGPRFRRCQRISETGVAASPISARTLPARGGSRPRRAPKQRRSHPSCNDWGDAMPETDLNRTRMMLLTISIT